RGPLLRARLGLVLRFPGFIGHAVDGLAALVLGHGSPLLIGRVLEPVRQAVAAEARQVHQVDVLDIGPFAQMRDPAPVDGGFEFRLGLVIKGHGRYPAVAQTWYYVGLVIESAKDSAKKFDRDTAQTTAYGTKTVRSHFLLAR